jgi:excinuclease ABC subunit A
MDLIIPDWELSINEGGIAPLGEEREAYVFKQVQQIAKKKKISLDKPLKKPSTCCSTATRKVIRSRKAILTN